MGIKTLLNVGTDVNATNYSNKDIVEIIVLYKVKLN